MIKKETKLYVVTWEDSAGDGENRWEFISDMEKPQTSTCISVGWITHETKKAIRIVPHISSVTNKNHQGCGQGLMIIPKCSIIKKIELKY